MAVRSLLSRVAKLEHSRSPSSPSSPFVLAYGSLDAWEAEWQAGIGEGRFDARDIPLVVSAVQRWHRDGVFAG